MESIEIKPAADGKIAVKSPYDSDFVARAKQLSGWFSDGYWFFPESQESRVRELCKETYGTDGNDARKVTLRLTLREKDAGGWARTTAISVSGWTIARVFGRDGGAKLSDGVVVVSGGFYSGGSRKNFGIGIYEDTVIELLDMPEGAAQMAIELADGGSDGLVAHAEIVGPTTVDVQALRDERARILARLEEIDALLK